MKPKPIASAYSTYKHVVAAMPCAGGRESKHRGGLVHFDLIGEQMKTLGYLVFMGVFGLELVLCALNPAAILKLEPWQIILLGFVAFRGGRAISYNAVFAWLREPFCRTVPDSSGAGDSVVPNPNLNGIRYVIGDCLACPICTGTHVASFMLVLIATWTPLGLIALYALGAAGIGEVIHWFAEKMEWEGRQAREQAGTEWLWKNDDGANASHSRMRGLPSAEHRTQRRVRRIPDVMPNERAHLGH